MDIKSKLIPKTLSFTALYQRFQKGLPLEGIVRASAIFLTSLFMAFILFDAYVYYLFFYSSPIVEPEKTLHILSEAYYREAVSVLDQREESFQKIATSSYVNLSNPFR